VTKRHGAEFSKAGCREMSLGGIVQHVTLIYTAKSLVCTRSTDPHPAARNLRPAS
jgi:hypothetical protein